MCFWKGESSWDVSSGHAWKMLGVRTRKALFVLLKCNLPEEVRTKQTWRHQFVLQFCNTAQQVAGEPCQQQAAHSRSSVGNKEENVGSTESLRLLSVWSLIMDCSHVRYMYIWNTSLRFISNCLISYCGKHMQWFSQILVKHEKMWKICCNGWHVYFINLLR